MDHKLSSGGMVVVNMTGDKRCVLVASYDAESQVNLSLTVTEAVAVAKDILRFADSLKQYQRATAITGQ